MEHLKDVGCYVGHMDLGKFTAVLSRYKKLPPMLRLGNLVTHILGNDIGKEVAKMIAKMYKPSEFTLQNP